MREKKYMQHNEIKPGSPEDWLRHAMSDLELSRKNDSPMILPEELCFHAQQAAEKALKSLLIYNNIIFPKTHNIKMLMELLPDYYSVKKDFLDAAILTDYAVTSRYPGDYEDITPEEYKEAVRIAEMLVKWAEQIIK
jgi:HEPN domain-containing protein